VERVVNRIQYSVINFIMLPFLTAHFTFSSLPTHNFRVNGRATILGMVETDILGGP
jgi:hypothetical protein